MFIKFDQQKIFCTATTTHGTLEKCFNFPHMEKLNAGEKMILPDWLSNQNN